MYKSKLPVLLTILEFKGVHCACKGLLFLAISTGKQILCPVNIHVTSHESELFLSFHLQPPTPALTPLLHLSPLIFSTLLFRPLLSLLGSYNLKLYVFLFHVPLPHFEYHSSLQGAVRFWSSSPFIINCPSPTHPFPTMPKLHHLFKCTPGKYSLVLDHSILLPSFWPHFIPCFPKNPNFIYLLLIFTDTIESCHSLIHHTHKTRSKKNVMMHILILVLWMLIQEDFEFEACFDYT